MILLLSGDEYVCKLGDTFYISDHTQILLNRYLACFEKIKVAFRTKKVCNSDELGKYHNKVTDCRVELCDMPFFQGPAQFAKKYFSVMNAAKKAAQGADIAIVRLPSTTAFAVWKVCRKRSIPYATEIVFDCHDAYVAAKSKSIRFIWKTLHNMQTKACNNALGVACVTRDYLQTHYFPTSPDAVVSNYSSIEMAPEFLFKPRKYESDKQFTIVHTANQVFFGSRKGHNQLIEALSIVRSRGIDAKIVFIGEDYNDGFAKLTEYAKSLGVANKIHFTGFLNRTELKKNLEEADLAVMPTKAEGLPRVIIEAMAMGLPCITTPVSGNPELIDKEFLVPYDNVEGIADRITSLLSDKDLYEKTSEENFNRSKEYTTEVLNPRRTKFYNSIRSMVENKY